MSLKPGLSIATALALTVAVLPSAHAEDHATAMVAELCHADQPNRPMPLQARVSESALHLGGVFDSGGVMTSAQVQYHIDLRVQSPGMSSGSRLLSIRIAEVTQGRELRLMSARSEAAGTWDDTWAKSGEGMTEAFAHAEQLNVPKKVADTSRDALELVVPIADDGTAVVEVHKRGLRSPMLLRFALEPCMGEEGGEQGQPRGGQACMDAAWRKIDDLRDRRPVME